MPQGHFGTVKVEKVHELHRLAFAQGGKIDAFRLVVELELDRVDLDVF